MLGWQIAKIDQPSVDINQYAQGYLIRLLIINKGHSFNSKVMAKALIGQPKAGEALKRGYEVFRPAKPVEVEIKQQLTLVLSRNDADYLSFLAINKLEPTQHKRIKNTKDIKRKKMTVILSPGWQENKNALTLLEQAAHKKANIIDSDEAGYQ